MFVISVRTLFRTIFLVHIAEGPLKGLAQYGGGFVFGNDLKTFQCRGEKAILGSINRYTPFGIIGMCGSFSLIPWYPAGLESLVLSDRGLEAAASRLAQRFIAYFSQCEEWWQTKKYGTHLYRNKSSKQMQRVLEKRHGKLPD